MFSIRNLTIVACCALIWSALGSISLAQHSDVFVYQRDGTLVTTNGLAEGRVFSNLFDFFGHPFGQTSLPRVFIADDPGFQTDGSPIAGTSTLPIGEVLYADFLPFQLPGGSSGNLLHWDLSGGSVDFQTVPDGHFFNVTDVTDDSSFEVRGDASRVEGVQLGVVSSGNIIHEHISLRLDDGDGNSSTDPMSGIYLMLLQVRLDGLETSEPFAVLLNSTDVSASDQSLAASFVRDLVDDIEILGQSLLGDFDADGDLGIGDIDQLVSSVASRSNDASFDLNGDGDIDSQDIAAWRSIAGQANLGAAYQPGDANLDGRVDAADFNQWNNNRFSSISAWSAGDFTADGFIDVSDFNIWNTNRTAAANQAAVPEPGVHFGFLLAMVAFCLRRSLSDTLSN